MLVMVENFKLLEKAGLQVVPYHIVSSFTEAAEHAEKLGYPVVLKVGLDIHKTEVGGVFVDIHDRNDLERSWKQIKDNLAKHDIKFDSLILQKQVSGTELILGLKEDSVFGKVVMLGSGGVFTEIERDVSFRACPINERDVIEMINEIKASALLKGARGKKPADMEKLRHAILNLSKLSGIKELDINPLFANEHGAWVADVRIFKA
jgi:acyl-CoA synthetase (NDP forming)